jgi:hypothetical protein
MHVQRCRRNGISSRPVAVTGLVLAVIVFGVILPALAQPSRARTGEVIAIRELQLKAGADTAQFEQFVRSTYNPAWEGAVPGMKGYIAKADRGAQKDSYALILVFDGEKTRDIVFPKEGGGASAAFAALVQPLLALNKDLDKFVEPGSLSVYTDYVVLR